MNVVYIYSYIGDDLVSLFLVAPAIDLSLELPVSEHIEQAFAIQWERLTDRKVRDAFCHRLATQLDTLLPEALDWDIKAPTQAQVSFALVISKGLGVSLPSEVLRYRGHMHEFLDRYAEAYKAQRTAPKPRT